MAFGRSNSLSINTGSGSSLFGSNQPSTSQPQQTGGLFGNAAPAAVPPQSQQSGSLFGNTMNNSQPQQQAGGLFGNAAAPSSQPQQPTSLFGNTTTSQPQQTSSLFGAAQPQQSGSLFGSANNANQQVAPTQSQPQSSFGGPFGQSLNQTQQPANSLFGGLGQNTQPQAQQSGGLFGGLGNQNKSAGSSLFGTANGQQNNNNSNNNNSGSGFGASLFNSAAPATASLAGSLTMGQGNTNNQTTVPGTKIDLSNLRPTTRFSDLHDDLKKQIEAIDTFIRQQESYSAQCEALLPNHSSNVDSIKPDVELITGKIETVELALENDSRAIEGAKALVKRDANDLMRCARVTENLTLPSQYHYGPSVTAAARSRAANTTDDDNYDVDLVAYFMRQADAMQTTLDTYTSHLAEIENHLRVIEVSTVQQAQQLAAQRSGSRATTSQDTVRELAETLRGFEHGILGAAGLVGSCREGVNELILGKIPGESREAHGARRSLRF